MFDMLSRTSFWYHSIKSWRISRSFGTCFAELLKNILNKEVVCDVTKTSFVFLAFDRFTGVTGIGLGHSALGPANNNHEYYSVAIVF
jgi:hypothetical protein